MSLERDCQKGTCPVCADKPPSQRCQCEVLRGTVPVPLTAREITRILIEERHPGEQWVSVPEMRCGCGYGNGRDRSIDLWAIKAAPSSGCVAVAYEIKLSKADFRRDLKDPEKQRGARTFSNVFYYVAPPGIIPAEELPAWAGLIEIHEPEPEPNRADHGAWWKWKQELSKRARVIVKAYGRDKCAPTWPFIVSLLRRVDPAPANNPAAG